MPNSPRKEVSLQWFTRVLRRYTNFYIEVVFLAVCVRLFGLIEPFVYQTLIDRVLPFQRESSLVVVLLVFLLLGICTIIFDFFSRYVALRTGSQAAYVFGMKVHKHYLDLPNEEQKRYPVGETVTRISETDTIRNFIVGTATGSILDLLFLVIYLIILFIISSKLAVIVILSLPLQLIIYALTGPIYRARLRAAFDARAKHQARLIETIGNVTSIKALGLEDGVRGRLHNTLTDVLSSSYRATLVQIINTKLIFFAQRALTVILFYVGALEVFSGNLSLGELVAFFLISQKISAPISNFSKLWESWQNIKISRLRLGDILTKPTEADDERLAMPQTGVLPVTAERLSYAYDGGQVLFEGLSFRLEPNTITTLAGPSGSGKTTIGKLVGSLLRPSQGQLHFGDYAYDRHSAQGMRRVVAYLPQDPALFVDTLRNNVTLGLEDVPDDQVWDALRDACIDTFVASLPNGLDTRIADQGSNLSGGQKQRIALARALIRDPKVLVLDEPTSALDDENQRAFAENLLELKKRFTLLVITHSPDAITGADQSIVLEGPK